MTSPDAAQDSSRPELLSIIGSMVAVERRQARTEGLLEGLRDAITAQRLQDPSGRKEST